MLKLTYLPMARQYNVLFLPSTATSVPPGVTFQSGALFVSGIVCPMTKLQHFASWDKESIRF